MSETTQLAVADSQQLARPTTPLAEVQEACAAMAARLVKARTIAAAAVVTDEASAAKAKASRAVLIDIRKAADEARIQVVGEIKRETARVDTWVRENVTGPADEIADTFKRALDPYMVAESDREMYARDGKMHWNSVQGDLPPNAHPTALMSKADSATKAQSAFAKAAEASKRFWPDRQAEFAKLAEAASNTARQYEAAAGAARQQALDTANALAAESAAARAAEAEREAERLAAVKNELPPTPPAAQLDLLGGPFDPLPPPPSLTVEVVIRPPDGTLTIRPPEPPPVALPPQTRTAKVKWVIDAVDLAVLPVKFTKRIADNDAILAALGAGETVPGVTTHRETAR